MALEQKEERTSIPGIVAIVIAVGAIVWFQQAPLESLRPPHSVQIEPSTPDQQKVESRLWQDPLEVVYRHIEKAQQRSKDKDDRERFEAVITVTGDSTIPKGKSIAASRGPRLHGTLQTDSTHVPTEDRLTRWPESIVGQVPAQQLTRVTILGVMLPGGPYGEAAEMRRRTRYAVISALHVEGFVPEDAESVRFFRRDMSPVALSDESVGSLVVPFERFMPEATGLRKDKVVVMWLDDKWFSKKPLQKLDYVLDDFRKALDAYTEITTEFKIIGPPDAGALQEMIEELNPVGLESFTVRDDEFATFADQLKGTAPHWCGRYINKETGEPRQGSFELLSPYATIEPYLWKSIYPALPGRIEERLIRYESMRQRVADLFDVQCAIRLRRAVGPDYYSARALIDELNRRGFGGPKDRIAVVAEADTQYGRFFPRQMRMVYGEDPKCDPVTNSTKCHVHYFSYMRGLDGQIADDSSAKASTKRAWDKNEKSELDQKAQAHKFDEKADGDSQQDYLRRLADRIRRTNRDSIREQLGEIKAIGVLGSDVYDKLLVLRALRDAFPKALFFTTDLDARMLHPSEIKWTRNLIVASSFGFELRPELQGHTPPFRDSYQTATFLAARLAVGESQTTNSEPAVEEWLKATRIFEIGQTRAFDLTALDERRITTCPDLSNCTFVHPVPARLAGAQRLWIGTLVILGMILIWALSYTLIIRIRGITKTGIRGLLWLGHDGWPSALHALVFSVCGTAIAMACIYGYQVAAGQWAIVQNTRLVLRLILAAIATCAIGFVLWRISITWRQKSRAPSDHFVWISIIGVVAGIALGTGAWIIFNASDGHEPWAVLDGVSVWPSVIIRAVAVVLAAFFLFRIWQIVDASERNIANRFALPGPDTLRADLPGFAALLSGPEIDRIRVTKWGDDSCQSTERRDIQEKIDAVGLWKEFVRRGTWRLRTYRSIPLTIISFFACWALFGLLGTPQVPYRGIVSQLVYNVVLFVSVFLFLWLVYIVVDVTKLCQRMINQLSSALSDWGTATEEKFKKNLGIGPPTVNDWIDLQWIAEHTTAISKIIYYPAIVLLLLIVARYRGFDNFEMNPALTIVFSASGLLAIACAITVRSAAERARSIAAERIVTRLIDAKGKCDPKLVDQLELILQRVDALREGAFAPYSQQPLVKALLIPFGGVGGAALLEYLTLFGV